MESGWGGSSGSAGALGLREWLEKEIDGGVDGKCETGKWGTEVEMPVRYGK